MPGRSREQVSPAGLLTSDLYADGYDGRKSVRQRLYQRDEVRG
ncbi:hypothetical protein [Streptomyces sp. enrichment culture]